MDTAPIPKSTGIFPSPSIDGLFNLLDALDDGHAQRTETLAVGMLEAIGIHGPAQRDIALAARLHDAGKRFVNPKLLLKPATLDEHELRSVREHVWHGYRVLLRHSSTTPRICAQVALLHHERLDGSGYPFGLRGAAIPFAARVIAVADVFDALVSERPYKPAWPAPQAIDHLRAGSGQRYDHRCVAGLIAHLERKGGMQQPAVLSGLPAHSVHSQPADGRRPTRGL